MLAHDLLVKKKSASLTCSFEKVTTIPLNFLKSLAAKPCLIP